MLSCGMILIYGTVLLISKNCSSCKAVLYTLVVVDLLIDGVSTTDWCFRGSLLTTAGSLGILKKGEDLPTKMSQGMEISSQEAV